MVDIRLVIGVLLAHFVADFMLQSDSMALNKSRSLKWLSFHVSVYTLALGLLMSPGLAWPALWRFALVNGAAHFLIDAVTSAATSLLLKRQQRHWFFVVIGFDQLLHTVILVLTLGWLA